MAPISATLLERLLRRLAGALYRFPRLFFYPQVILFFLCLFYTLHSLKTDFSRNNLVGRNKKYHQIYLRYKEEFPFQDDLVVVVESENLEKNRQFVERLGARLEKETNLFTDVFYKGDLKMMGDKALLFVSENDLTELRNTLRDCRPVIQHFARAPNLEALFSLVNRQFLAARREPTTEAATLTNALPALERIVTQARDSLERPGTPVSPGINALFNAGPEAESQMYITFAKDRIYLVTARALTEQANKRAVVRLRELMAQTQQEVPGLNVGLTGEPVLEIDEMEQSEKDTAVATVVSFVLVFLIIIYGYGKVSRRIKADLCLIVGMVYTMAFTTLVIGHLNILTVTFAPILIGLAIDFGVHLITRYEEELRRGRPMREAMEKALVATGLGIVTGCLTTAGAFLAMAVTNFKGIQEMGVICGGGLVICLVPMMTLLPVLLLRGTPDPLEPAPADAVDRRAQLERLWLQRPVLTICITAACCAAAAIGWRKVGFDYNLIHMQSEGLPAVQYEKKLINSASRSVLFGAVLASNATQAAWLEARLKALPAVATVESLHQFLSQNPTRKQALIGEIKREIQSIQFAEPDREPVNVWDLSRTLWSLQGYLGAAMQEVKTAEPALYRQLSALRDAIQDLRRTMLSGDPDQRGAKLAAYQQAFFQDVRDTFVAMQNQDDRSALAAQDLPLALRNRLVGKSGVLLLQVYPKEDVWERQPQAEFVRQLRSVDPTVTGTPVQLYEYTTLLKESYEEAASYSLIAIALLIFFHFRRVTCILLALLPVGIGFLYMTGLMGWCGVSFNPANIMTLPLVIGIGVTNGIHILNRFAEEQHPSILARSTGKAVLVSGLTTIVGFGSLSLAKHQGIASLGFVMAIGTAGCMLAGLTFLPAVLTLMHRRGWRLTFYKS